MSNRKSFLAGIAVALMAAFTLLMLSGAVVKKSPNYYQAMGGNNDYSAMHVACNSSGSTVYITDETRVMRSRDHGESWQIVMTSSQRESTQK